MNSMLKAEITMFVAFVSTVLSIYTYFVLKAIETDYSVFKVLVIFIVLHALAGIGLYKWGKEDE